MHDKQGFNVLHLATHSSSIMLIVYLLHHGMSVDATDPQEHTPMMWAAYQGDALSVDLFLRWGASVKATDVHGLTALHWAIVRGNRMCIKRLIEEGSDVNAITADGKTPVMMAEEMKCILLWERVLRECDRDSEGMPKRKLLSPVATNRFVFIAPTIIIWTTLQIFSLYPLYFSCIISLGWLVGSNYFITYFVMATEDTPTALQSYPYLAGIFAGTAILVLLRWMFHILPNTFYSHPFLNTIFGLLFLTAIWSFMQAMISDPGYVPRPSGRTEQTNIIEDLINVGELDSRHFCTKCFVRKPLRSKHCRICGRCVARHDQ